MLVGVEPQALVGADGGAHRCHHLGVQIVAAAHLDVDHLVARVREPAGGLRHLLRRFALREAEVAHLVAHRAAEQRVNGLARGLAHDVPERHLQPGQHLARKARRAAGALQLEQRVVGLAHEARVLERAAADADLGRTREIGLDAFGGRRGDRLAVAGHAVVGADLDQDHAGAQDDTLGKVIGLRVGDPERRRMYFANPHPLSSKAQRPSTRLGSQRETAGT